MREGCHLGFESLGFGGGISIFGSNEKMFGCVSWDCHKFLFRIRLNLGNGCMSLWLNE